MLNLQKNNKSSPQQPVLKRSLRRSLDGVLILDKPKGMSSNAALQVVKRLFGAEKAGHTGSLDPLASGLLPICFGEATKFSRFLLESDKHYRFTAKLGIKTDTGDAEGTILEKKKVPTFSLKEIEEVLNKFRGIYHQIPPMYSALKHQGQPLYKLARQGITVERASRELFISQLTLLSFEFENDCLQLEVKASSGTYVRTLAEDIGDALGCGAHVVELRRLAAGPYSESQMIPLSLVEKLNTVEQGGSSALDNCLLPIDTLLLSFPKIDLSDSAAFYLKQGQPVFVPKSPTSGWVSLISREGKFLGVGEILDDGKVTARRLIKQG